MKYNKLSGHLPNKVNPFISDTIAHVEKGEKVLYFSNKEHDLIIDKDGVVKGHSMFARKIKVDRANFTKVFKTGLSNWFDLSKSAIRVFAYIGENIKADKDFILIDFDDLMVFTKYKSRSILMSALSELIDNKFIARGKAFNLYYINPTIFFNGDRLTLLSQYEVSDKKSSSQNIENIKSNLLEMFDEKIQDNSESRE